MVDCFFFFWGGGLGWGVEKFDETCEVIYRMRWNKREQLVIFLVLSSMISPSL